MWTSLGRWFDSGSKEVPHLLLPHHKCHHLLAPSASALQIGPCPCTTRVSSFLLDKANKALPESLVPSPNPRTHALHPKAIWVDCPNSFNIPSPLSFYSRTSSWGDKCLLSHYHFAQRGQIPDKHVSTQEVPTESPGAQKHTGHLIVHGKPRQSSWKSSHSVS